MGCGPSKGTTSAIISAGNGDLPTESISHEEVIPPPVAFVIPLEENNDANNELPAPPARIQRLLEEQSKSPPSPSRIFRKLASAERRRTQILQQRAGSVMSAKERPNRDGDSVTMTTDRSSEEDVSVMEVQ